MKLALGPRGMNLSLRQVGGVAVAAIGMAAITGCGGSARSAAALSTAVGTTTLTSALITPSALAPAAWDDELAATPPPAVPTWGSAVTSTTTK